MHSSPLCWPVAAIALLLAACATPVEPQGPDRCHPRAGGAQCLVAPPRPLGMLAANNPVSVRVDARCEWNPTGVILERGARYRVAVTRELEPWRGPDPGNDWRRVFTFERQTQHWSRARELPIGTLVAAQGREARTFIPAGPETSFTAASGEELLFFSNDWPGAYANNEGCLELEIRKLVP